MTDAFDQWREWAGKPAGDRRTSPAESYHAVMDLPPEDRFDREKVNEAALNNDKSAYDHARKSRQSGRCGLDKGLCHLGGRKRMACRKRS